MGIGAGIFLVALGAILTFAVNWKISGLDLHAVGWVLMIAGVAGTILFFVFWNRRRSPGAVVAQRSVVTERPVSYQDPTPPPPAPPGY
jgi:Na+/proline symporter